MKPNQFSLHPLVVGLALAVLANPVLAATVTTVNQANETGINDTNDTTTDDSQPNMVAETTTNVDPNKVIVFATTTITGNSEQERRKNVGSAHSFSDEDLSVFQHTDVHDVLDQVPGVYSRDEDGYGLRPNIAIRGVRAERSQNVTIMEDGILITPAPYAAPAAYYFPNVARMKTVEVFKGPSAIKYGPRTVGGAINFVSQPTSEGASGKVSASYGSDNQYKLYGKYGNSLGDTFAYAIEGLVYGADGFLDIDNSDKKTGFSRRDVNLKVGWYPEVINDDDLDQMLIAKLGYADEKSNQTYLGISDDDFNKNPYRRYMASQNDHFESSHYQLHLMHFLYLPNDLSIETKAYYNRFNRDWNKVDGFANTKDSIFGGDKIAEVLKNPDANATFYNILTGKVNTADLDVPYLNLGIDLTNNSRRYDAMGINVEATKSFEYKQTNHELEAGIRVHKDGIDRHHTTKGYAVADKKLVFNGFSGDKLINSADSTAVAAFLLDTITYQDWKFSLGLRSENISSTLEEQVNDFQKVSGTNKNHTNKESAIMPGAGFYYQMLPEWGVLAGVHRGFSPAGPGRAGNTADSESSTNYEAGVRFASNKVSINAEMIGFYSDYNNVIGRARASNGAALVGSSFNSGSVDIYGAEFALDGEFTHKLYRFPIQFAYTYTDSEFKNSFNSKFKEWGNVTRGDELPYVPKHKARLQFGAELQDEWRATAAINFTGKMREKAGSGSYVAGESTKNSAIVDISGTRFVNDKLSYSIKMQNVFNNNNIASHRPFGARPIKPRSIAVSSTYEF